MKWAHSGAYSRHWATNIHIGCNSCGRIFNPNEAWVECHLLKSNQDFPAGARPPWTGGKSGLNPGDRVAHIWIPQGFGLGSAPHGSWYFAVPYICVGLQRWKDVGNRTEGSRRLSSAQVMSGGVWTQWFLLSRSSVVVVMWLLSVILEYWLDRDQSGLLYHGRALTLQYSDHLVK